VILCVATADHPVVPIVRRLIRDHPEISARLLVGGEQGGPNRKLANLRKAWTLAKHDCIVLADSNVLIPPDYLKRLLARWSESCAFVCSSPSASTSKAAPPSSNRHSSTPLVHAGNSPPTRLASASFRAKTILLRRNELDREGAWQLRRPSRRHASTERPLQQRATSHPTPRRRRRGNDHGE
jgi:ceramide glucosyltransferase